MCCLAVGQNRETLVDLPARSTYQGVGVPGFDPSRFGNMISVDGFVSSPTDFTPHPLHTMIAAPDGAKEFINWPSAVGVQCAAATSWRAHSAFGSLPGGELRSRIWSKQSAMSSNVVYHTT